MPPRVLVTRHVYPAAIAILQEAGCVVDYHDSRDGMTPEQLGRRVRHADGLLCQLTDPIPAELLAGADKLQVISQIAVGHDNIDIAAASARRIVVTNTPDVLTEATADLTLALMLAVARRLPEAERFLRAGSWQRWEIDLLCGNDVHGATLGIVGFGRIGRAVARRARGFRMRVLYAARNPAPPEVERELEARQVPLDMLLQRSDYVSLHVPLSPATEHLIGVAQLARMKPTAFLINTARGPVVDERALIAALEEGLLAGAGLDVFEREPAVPAELLALPNVVALPHVGSATVAVRTRMCAIAARDCAAVLTGERPEHPVNPEVLE
ncbi:MAG: D-glycerate dehydrogenase [Planctomycetes bacterium]|nr:D-glycerate dehydrogenase [Planctomycetota bacterium]